ncbi:hypothetical protein HYFRA_00009094 [Hymenoscyphus fraxineus]|uniref:DnaJ homolog 1, mitochondrial n=1 Tax=Hymenoscyphus fraxineus TaxID=746836 RepID=A0A9N9KTK5_9HELO|nr:hypothetical protein HYFRA_00009094 [Hymenoscyphus fraxineus]
MKNRSTCLFTKAATTRITCPARASRPVHLKKNVPINQSRSICSAGAVRTSRFNTIAPVVQVTRSQKRQFHATPRSLATKDPYSVLGVDKNASAGEIKRAYYGLAKKYHPDTNKDPSAKDKFAEAQSSYELLTDPQKKAAWDQFGSAAFDQGGAGPNPGPGGPDPFAGFGGGFGGFGGAAGASGGFGGGFSSFNFEDLFPGFSPGGRAGRGGPQHGEDITVQVSISFMDAAKGVNKTIRIDPLVTCKTCTGSGLKPGVKKTGCKSCGGTGTQVHFVQGGFQMASTCNACGGAGLVTPRKGHCGDCNGEGVVKERKTITVNIPAGIADGTYVRLQHEGDAPRTADSLNPDARSIPGHLNVLVQVATDPKFTRSGSNIHYNATIPLTTAILGGEVTIPTLNEPVKVKVATGTSTGSKITLSGMGMQVMGSRRGAMGDLKVEFTVSMPKYLTSNQRTIAEMLADELGDESAKRIMNVRRDGTGNETKQDGFLKSVWNKLGGHSDAGSENSEGDKK